MKIHVVKNETRIHMNPTEINSILFSLGVDGLCVWSKMMKPNPPMEKRKLDARPSMMYCPLTRLGMNATGLEWPCSSVVEPTPGGSTITSNMIPKQINIKFN